MKQKFLCFFLVLLLVNLTVKTSEAIAPAIAIPAVAIGTAILATGAGTYYATSDNPVVVKGKEIFQKAHLAKKIGLDLGSDVLGDLMADGGGFYAGVPAYIGASVRDVVDYVQESGGNAYSYWSGLIDDFLSDDVPDLNENPVPDGSIYTLPNGITIYIDTLKHDSRWSSIGLGSVSPPFLFKDGSWYIGFHSVYSSTRVYLYRALPNGQGKYILYARLYPVVDDEPTYFPPPASIDYDGLVSAFNPADAKDETEKILSQLPPTSLVASASPDVAGIGGQNDVPPALSNSQIQSLLGQMQSDVSGQLADDIGGIATSNPDDVNAQIESEKAQADAEQKALEEAEEALNTPSSIPADPEWGELDLSPLLVLKDAFLSNAPFSWLVDLGTIWDVLVTDPVAPVFTVNLGIVSHDVDLSVFDSFAALIRSVMSFLVYLGTGWFLINVWRNM